MKYYLKNNIFLLLFWKTKDFSQIQLCDCKNIFLFLETHRFEEKKTEDKEWGQLGSILLQVSSFVSSYQFSKMFFISKEIRSLKTLDTIGNCQRPVFSLSLSQHMHKITNLWKFEPDWSSKLLDNYERKKTPL